MSTGRAICGRGGGSRDLDNLRVLAVRHTTAIISPADFDVGS